MLITIDMLQSYIPVFIDGKKYWKFGDNLYQAEINKFGMVEVEKVTKSSKSLDKTDTYYAVFQ